MTRSVAILAQVLVPGTFASMVVDHWGFRPCRRALGCHPKPLAHVRLHFRPLHCSFCCLPHGSDAAYCMLRCYNGCSGYFCCTHCHRVFDGKYWHDRNEDDYFFGGTNWAVPPTTSTSPTVLLWHMGQGK